MQSASWKFSDLNPRLSGDLFLYFQKATESLHIYSKINSYFQGITHAALSHEFTHFVEELSAEKFRKFTDILFDVLGKNDVDVNRLIEAKEAVLRNTEEYKGRSEKELRAIAYSEVVAEMMEPVLTDTDAISRISQKIKQQDKSLWGKIKEFIRGIVEKLKAAYRDMAPDSAIARLTRETVTNSEAVLDAFSEAAADAVLNYNLQDGQKNNAREGVQFSTRENKNEVARMREVSSVSAYDGSLKATDIVNKVSEFFESIGGSVNNKELGTISLRRRGIKNDVSHGIGREKAASFMAVPDILQKGKVVDYQTNWKGRGYDTAVIAAPIKIAGVDYLAGVCVKRTSTDSNFYVHEVLPIKNEGTMPFNRAALESVDSGGDAPSINSILLDILAVKGNFLKSSRDSAGNTLTEAQQRYFADSQVRDEDGNLKVVYHGSPAIFTEFSADFMSSHGSSEGQGFYFTDYKPMAEGYQKSGGQLLEGYLNIQKPLSDSEVTLKRAEVRKLLQALDPTGDDLVLNYDSGGGMGYPSRSWYNRALNDTLNAVMGNESDSEILGELANAMGDSGAVLEKVRSVLGYDGYIVSGKYDNANVYVAFDSSQFKNADNKTPTGAKDFRYSSRTASDSEYLNLAQNPEENREALSRMVEQAAKEAGYTRLFFHGSKKGGGFTVFRDWQYFTENREYAKRYANRENPGSLYETYVKMENPFDTRIPEVRELFEQARQEYGMGELQENGLPDWTDGYDIADYIDENDLPYDGIILDEGGDMVNGKPVSRGLSYVIRDSSQVKSADAVTYDDNGNVIPLSQRFDMGKEDIRYSARYTAAEENPEIADLVQRVLSGDFKANDKVYLGTVSSQNAARIQEITGINVDGFRVAIEARQIEHILNRHGIEGSADHSMAQVSNISKIQYTLDNPDSITPAGKTSAYVYMRNGKNRTADTVLYEKDIGGKSYYTVQAIADTKAKTLYVVSAFIGESGYKKGTPQFTNAKSLGATSETAAVDVPTGNVAQSGTNVKGENLESRRVSQDIKDAIEEYRRQQDVQSKAYRQMYDRQLEEVKKSYQKQISSMEVEYSANLAQIQDAFFQTVEAYEKGQFRNEHLEKALKQAAETQRAQAKASEADNAAWEKEFKRLLKAYEASGRNAQRLKQTVENQRARAKAKVEAARVTEQRGKLYRAVNEINRRLLNPTKTLYVPDSLAPAVTKFMQGLTEAMESPQNRWNVQGALETLQGQYQKLTQMNEGVFTQEYNQGILDLLDNAINAVGGTDFNKLSESQIEDVYSAVRSVLTAIRNENKMFAANLNKTYAEAAAAVLREESGLPNRKPTTGAVQDKAEKFGWNQLKPVYAMMRLGSDTLLKQYNNLRAGEDKWQRTIAAARAYGLGIMEKYHYDQWNDSLMKLDTETGTVELSLEERMSLYAYARREQAFEHLTKGGFVLSDKNTRTVKNRLGVETEQI